MKRGERWFSEKLRKIFDLDNFRSESFSIRTSRIESSRFRARVAKGRPAFRDRITRGNLESKIVYQGVGADFEKQKKISANNEQGSMKRGEKWFSEKLLKNLDSRLILDTYLLYRELPLPSSCCKGEACLPRSH